MSDIDRALDLLRTANPVTTIDHLDDDELAASIAACERLIDDQLHAEPGGVTVVTRPLRTAVRPSIAGVRPLLVPAATFAVVVMAIVTITFGTTLLSPATDPEPPAAPMTTIGTTRDESPTPNLPEPAPYDIAIDHDLVYWTDGEADYTVDVYYPAEGDGPWPVAVVYPYNVGGATEGSLARAMAERGAVVFAPVSVLARDLTDSATYVDGVLFDRASCAVGFAQARAGEYGGDPARTTLIGEGGGEHHATWAALGLVRDDVCDEPIRHPPVGLVVGMPQWLFQVEYWDETILDSRSNASDTLDRFWNPDRWQAADDLRVHIWTTADPSNRRAIATPLTDDSWIHDRDTTGTLVRDFEAVGALDDGEIRYDDNARVMYLRMRRAGIAVTLDQTAAEGWRSAELAQHDRMWAIVSGGG